jgi:hypothetical protein
MEIHHIILKSEGGKDTFENGIPLCLDCHADQRSYDSKHPKGSKYTRSELISHRDSWYAKVVSSPPAVYTSDSKQLDAEVFAIIKQIVRWDGSIKVAREHIFSVPFRYEWFEEFEIFQNRCSDPAFEFIDADLEILMAEFKDAIDNFMNLIHKNGFVFDDNMDYMAVPQQWKVRQTDVFYKAVKDLEDAGGRVGTVFDSLIRTGRRKVGV